MTGNCSTSIANNSPFVAVAHAAPVQQMVEAVLVCKQCLFLATNGEHAGG